MKKITLLLTLMMSSLGFSQPTVSAPVPTRLQANVVSVFSDTYSSIATNYNPNWGQSGAVNTTYNPGDGNLALAYTNFNYQGTNVTNTNLSTMEYLHIDVWTNQDPTNFILQVSPINAFTGAGEKLVTINHIQNSWYSVDIPKSSFTGMTWDLIKEIKFAANGVGSTPPGDIYLDNIYFWKTPAAAGTPTIGALAVPAKKVGDANFVLTNPTSDSPGAFSYTSSNTTVATISGNTVTIKAAGSTTITANQAASGGFIAGSVTANFIVTSSPLTPAPVPTKLQANVVSIFSDSYTSIATDFNPNWGQNGTVNSTFDTGSGNMALVYTNFNYQGTNVTHTDLSTMEYLHIDVWSNQDPANFILQVTPINASTGAGETLVTINHTKDAWYSVDIPKSAFTGMTWDLVKEMKFAANGPGSTPPGDIYLDNVYFWKNPTLSVSSFEKSNIKMFPNPANNFVTIKAENNIEQVSIYSVLGQEVIAQKPNTTTVTLDLSNNQKGMYFVKVTINGVTSTSKMVIE